MFETALVIPARSRFGARVLPAAVAAHFLAGSAIFLANSWRVDALPEPIERMVFASFVERLPLPEETPKPEVRRPEPAKSEAATEQPIVPRDPEPTAVLSTATLDADVPPAPEFPQAGSSTDTTATTSGNGTGDATSDVAGDVGDGDGDGDFIRCHAGIQRPEAILRVEPAYTDAARRARIQGYLILDLYVDERGSVARVDVLKGLPMGLTEAAVDAARRWRFRPAERGGRAIPIVYSVTVNFHLS